MKVKILDIIATPREVEIPDNCSNCSVSFKIKEKDIPDTINNLRLWGLEELVADASIVIATAGEALDNFTSTERIGGFVIRIACNKCNTIVADGIPASQDELHYLKKVLEL